MTILKQKWVKIRKPQRCFACYNVKPPGTRMFYQVHTIEEFTAVYTCEDCDAFIKEHRDMVEDGYGLIPEGVVWEVKQELTREEMQDDPR